MSLRSPAEYLLCSIQSTLLWLLCILQYDGSRPWKVFLQKCQFYYHKISKFQTLISSRELIFIFAWWCYQKHTDKDSR